MNNKMTLVMIYGYARSGKTTLMNGLASKGYSIVSTSQELDYLTIERLNLPRYFVSVLREKDDAKLQKYLKNKLTSCREEKIKTAEKYFIPLYGRKSLIRMAFTNQLDFSSILDNTVFFETIGGEEADLVERVWSELNFGLEYDIKHINIHSDNEVKGVDIRKLSNNPEAVEFKNNLNSLQDTIESFREALGI